MLERHELQLRGTGWSKDLPVDGEFTFGRGGPGVDIALSDDPRLHRHCGSVVVDSQGWELRNTGRWLQLRLISVDRFGVIQLVPGDAVRVPWFHARVQIHLGARCHEFTARLVGNGADAEPLRIGALAGERADVGDASGTAEPIRVNRGAGYFRALVALCEPRLVDPTSSEVATDLQIAQRLNRTGAEDRRVTGKTVERRLDHCRTRFGLKATDEFGHTAGLERRDARRVLAEAALLAGVVTVADLSLLAPGVDAA